MSDVNLVASQISADVATKAISLSNIATSAITEAHNYLADLTTHSMGNMTLEAQQPSFKINKSIAVTATISGTLPDLNSVNMPGDVGDPAIPDYVDTVSTDDLDALYADISNKVTAFGSSTISGYDIGRVATIRTDLLNLIDLNATWSRMSARNQGVIADIDSKVNGLTLNGCPATAYSGFVADIRLRLGYAVDDIDREKNIKSSDLNYEDSKFIRSTTISIESLILTNYDYMAKRAIEGAETTIRLSIDLFKAAMAKYDAESDKYKTDAVIFMARKRAQFAIVELFRTRTEACVAKIRGLSGKYDAEVKKYSSDILIQKLNNEVQHSLQQLSIKQAESNLDTGIKTAEANYDAVAELAGLRVNNMIEGADLLAQEAHAAINALDITAQQAAELISLENE